MKISAIVAIWYQKRIGSAILQFSMVRCEKFIANSETGWGIQVNSAKISLLIEVFV